MGSRVSHSQSQREKKFFYVKICICVMSSFTFTSRSPRTTDSSHTFPLEDPARTLLVGTACSAHSHDERPLPVSVLSDSNPPPQNKMYCLYIATSCHHLALQNILSNALYSNFIYFKLRGTLACRLQKSHAGSRETLEYSRIQYEKFQLKINNALLY